MDDMIRWLTISTQKKTGARWSELMNTDLLAALSRIDKRLADQLNPDHFQSS